jgi:hypothetical protein
MGCNRSRVRTSPGSHVSVSIPFLQLDTLPPTNILKQFLKSQRITATGEIAVIPLLKMQRNIAPALPQHRNHALTLPKRPKLLSAANFRNIRARRKQRQDHLGSVDTFLDLGRPASPPGIRPAPVSNQTSNPCFVRSSQRRAASAAASLRAYERKMATPAICRHSIYQIRQWIQTRIRDKGCSLSDGNRSIEWIVNAAPRGAKKNGRRTETASSGDGRTSKPAGQQRRDETRGKRTGGTNRLEGH